MASESQNAATLEAAGAWSSEAEFIGTDDDLCMTTGSTTTISGEFSFNFASVEGTINGIEVTVHWAGGDSNDYAWVDLYDTTSTWCRMTLSSHGAALVCATAQSTLVGGPTNLWTGTFTAAHIKSSAFRIRVESKAQGKSGAAWAADWCQVTVYYTAVGAEEVIVTTMT